MVKDAGKDREETSTKVNGFKGKSKEREFTNG
jgi:hypothetical protein